MQYWTTDDEDDLKKTAFIQKKPKLEGKQEEILIKNEQYKEIHIKYDQKKVQNSSKNEQNPKKNVILSKNSNEFIISEEKNAKEAQILRIAYEKERDKYCF